MLVNTTTHEELGTVLFPSMNFTCDGRISKLTFLAVQGELRSTELKFALGRSIGLGFVFTLDNVNASNASIIGGSGTGYELKYEVNFQEGDMLSVFQVPASRHHLLHQTNKVIETCTLTGERSMKDVNCTVYGDLGQPLVAMETGTMSCIMFVPPPNISQHSEINQHCKQPCIP